MHTKDDCKKWLSKIGIKLGVAPNLIATRLLSDEDKEAMLRDEISFEALELHTRLWITGGLRNYANGSGELYEKRYDYEGYLGSKIRIKRLETPLKSI